MQAIPDIEISIWESLCELEEIIEPRNMTLALHNMGHFAQQVRRFGPVRETWAYGAESKLGTMKRKARNKYLPGANIMQRQIDEEGLRLIIRVAKSTPSDEEYMLSRDFEIQLKGGKTVRKLTNYGYPLVHIERYIQENWIEFAELRSKLGLEDVSIWGSQFQLDEGTVQSFNPRHKAIIGNRPREVTLYQMININGTSFETQRHTETKTRTSNSTIEYKKPWGKNIGQIQSIIHVQVRQIIHSLQIVVNQDFENDHMMPID